MSRVRDPRDFEEGGYFGPVSFADIRWASMYQHKSSHIRHSDTQTMEEIADRAQVKALRVLKEELISLRNGFVNSIGKLIDIIDSAEVEDSIEEGPKPLHTVDVGTTTTEITTYDQETFTSDELSTPDRFPLRLENKASNSREIYTSVDIGTPSCWEGSSFATASSSPYSFRTSPGRGPRRRGIVGSGPASPRFAAVSTVEEIFVSNVDLDTSISDVFLFLKRKVTVVRLTQISHPDARSKSFVLSVPSYELDNVLCPKFWPIGVRCREFIRPTVGRLANVG